MKEHVLKCWPAEFEAIRVGRKTADVRIDDGRGFEVGDTLVLQEWDPKAGMLDLGAPVGVDPATGELRFVAKPSGDYTGRAIRRRVTDIVRSPTWDLPPGMVVMSIMDPAVILGRVMSVDSAGRVFVEAVDESKPRGR
jgi:hypothetical protein